MMMTRARSLAAVAAVGWRGILQTRAMGWLDHLEVEVISRGHESYMRLMSFIFRF